MKTIGAERLPRREDAWEIAIGMEGETLHKWTKSGQPGLEFTLKIIHSPPGVDEPVIRFYRNGRKAKSPRRSRFLDFFDRWCAGARSADDFQNDGLEGSNARSAYFLLAVFEELARRSCKLTTNCS